MRKITLHLTFIFVFIGLFSGNSFAQYFLPEKSLCEQLKSRTVIVELNDDASDNVLRNAFNDFWTLTPVEFLSSAEFSKVLATGDTKYAALLASSEESSHTMQRVSGYGGSVETVKIFYFSHFNIRLSLITGPGTQNTVCDIAYANKNIMTGDLLFAVQQISLLVNATMNNITGSAYYDHNKNMEFVKTKTLLIPQELFKEKEIPSIASKYDFPFKVVSLKTMNDMVLSKDETLIYPKIIWSPQHQFYGWVTISAKDGHITSFMSFGGFQFAMNVKADEVIKVKDLKYITSKMAQGINNKYD